MNKTFEKHMDKKSFNLLKMIHPRMSKDAVAGCDVRVCRKDKNRLKNVFSIFDLPNVVTSIFYTRLDRLTTAALTGNTMLELEFESFEINGVASEPTKRQRKAIAMYLIKLEQEHIQRQSQKS